MRQFLMFFAMIALLLSSCNSTSSDDDSVISLLNEAASEYQVRSSNNIEWSPDSLKLLMETSQGNVVYLTLFNVETSEVVNLYVAADYEILSFDWNPTNSSEFVLTITRSDQNHFYIGDLESQTLTQINTGYATQWLKDGASILVNLNEFFYIYNINDDDMRPLSDAAALSFAPNYRGEEADTFSLLADNNLVLEGTDNYNRTQRNNLGPATGSGIWSPNSNRLAVMRYETSPHDYSLLVFSLIGDLLLQVQANQETSFSWSHRSNFVTYDRAGEVFVVNIEEQIETLIANGFSPSWSPDGEQIAYIDYETRSLQFFDTSSLPY